MKSLALAVCVLSAVCSSSCGSVGADNVAACKTFYISLRCGMTDLSSNTSTCDAYANTTCDISPYFGCLKNHYVCTNNMYETAPQSTVAECAPQAVCK